MKPKPSIESSFCITIKVDSEEMPEMSATTKTRTSSEEDNDDKNTPRKRQRISKEEEEVKETKSKSPTIPTPAENGTTLVTTAATKETQQHGSQQLQQHPRCQNGSLFVGSLHPRVADIHLRKLFEPYGTVQRVHRVRGENYHGSSTPSSGVSRNFAFVEFATRESAQLAMERVHGRVLLGKNLVVRPARERAKTDRGGISGARDVDIEASSSSNDGKQGDDGNARKRNVAKERSEIELKIAAVKRALEAKKKT
mmetsp:Transcript_32240/g.48085  ORF Transcript_32240/g.48085 Transcript_32240/m.48085 type:complete len:254 (-) Transcript_32240:280-1041(-)